MPDLNAHQVVISRECTRRVPAGVRADYCISKTECDDCVPNVWPSADYMGSADKTIVWVGVKPRAQAHVPACDDMLVALGQVRHGHALRLRASGSASPPPARGQLA